MKIDEKLSASGALPLDPAGGSAPDPRYTLALHGLAMVHPSLWHCQILAPALARDSNFWRYKVYANICRGSLENSRQTTHGVVDVVENGDCLVLCVSIYLQNV